MRTTQVIQTLVVAMLLFTAACSGGAESPASQEESAPAAPSSQGSEMPDAAGSTEGSPVASESSEPGGSLTSPNCEELSGDASGMTCTTSVFAPQLSFTLPEGWESESEFPYSSSYLKDGEGDVVPYLGFNRVPKVYEYGAEGSEPQVVDAPGDVTGMVSYLADLPGTEATEPQDVTVDGRDAVQIDFTVQDPPQVPLHEECGPAPEGVFAFTSGRHPCDLYFFPTGAGVRAVVLDVSDGRGPLVIALEFPPEQRNQVYEEFSTIIESLAIETG